jgi:hypothetical protein
VLDCTSVTIHDVQIAQSWKDKHYTRKSVSKAKQASESLNIFFNVSVVATGDSSRTSDMISLISTSAT